MSSFPHPQVVPNLYECLCSAEHKDSYSEECGKQSSSGTSLTSLINSMKNRFFLYLLKITSTSYPPTMEVNGAPKQPGYKLINLQKYIPLSVDENKNIICFYFKCKN